MRSARRALLGFVALLAMSSYLACQDARRGPAEASTSQAGANMAIQVTSKAFAPGATIPAQYTCMGQDVSPPLEWTGVPQKTQSLALVAHDPDAPSGDFTHWLLYGMAASATQLPEGVAKAGEVPGVGRQGTNGFRKVGYGGPCPPPGKPHRYFFRVYALDNQPKLAAGASRSEVEAAIQGHVLAEGELMGKFGR